MASSEIRRGIHRTVMTLGMAFLLIGVVLLTVSDRVFILGICFLGAGSLAVLGYLIVTLFVCVKKNQRAADEENATESENRQSSQRQIETDSAQFDAPRYEDVILSGSTIWTVTLGPPPDIEPPPYHSDLARRRGAVADLRIQNPVLLRVSSDIHELKRLGLIKEERWPEPLTPPPSYNESMTQWEDVFEPSQEEG
ncbi:transmembrane protein 139 [Pyxicephalus adspersus]|uniref:transmembrane protein 139 n=1 Tax=Pyxicephalus adspersus TaxID=30357 RepID=UPI003B5C4F61